MEKTRNPGEILKEIMNTDLKTYGQEITKMVPMFVKDPSKLPELVTDQETESQALANDVEFLKNEYDVETVKIIKAEDSNEQKAKKAAPGKPAIMIEK